MNHSLLKTDLSCIATELGFAVVYSRICVVDTPMLVTTKRSLHSPDRLRNTPAVEERLQIPNLSNVFTSIIHNPSARTDRSTLAHTSEQTLPTEVRSSRDLLPPMTKAKRCHKTKSKERHWEINYRVQSYVQAHARSTCRPAKRTREIAAGFF
jgi:hypothetical protein